MITLQGQRPQMMNHDEELLVTRDTDVRIIDGKPVKVGRERFKVLANVQPVEGRDLLLVPEFDRFKENYFVFTQTPLLVNDRVARLGFNYQVQKVQAWGDFVECIMTKMDVGPEATP